MAKLFVSSARENRRVKNKDSMKKDEMQPPTFAEDEPEEMRPEYDLASLTGRVRGKYVERYRAGTNLVLLEPDVAAAFPDAIAANQALRLLMEVAQRQAIQP